MNKTRSQRRQEQFQSRMRKKLSTMSPDTTCQFTVIRHGETDWNIQFRLQGQMYPGPPLNMRGKQQAHALSSSSLLSPLSQFDAIYTSDLVRTVETTDIIIRSHGSSTMTVNSDDDSSIGPIVCMMKELRERYLGPLQGLTLVEGRQQYPDAYNALVDSRKHINSSSNSNNTDNNDTSNTDIHNTNTIIESLHSLQQRVGNAFEHIAMKHQGKKVLIITHGGVLNALYSHATNEAAPKKASNASISVFYYDCGSSNIISNRSNTNTNSSKKGGGWCVVEWSNEQHLIDNGIGMLSYGGDVVDDDDDNDIHGGGDNNNN